MAARGLFNATDLEPLLAERGISLSSVQVWRLVTQVPERLSLQVLAALCDILEASPADLIVTTAGSAAALPKVAAANAPVDPDAMRPRRATLKPQAE
jgi:DNA-binding Xre family transcriptional regulator